MSTADFLFPFVHIFPQVKQHDTPRRGTADVYDLLSSPRPKCADMFFSSGVFFFVFFFSSPHLSFLTQTWIWGQNVKVLRSTRCLFVHLVHFLIFCSCLDLCASSGDFLPLIYGRQESFSSSTLMLQYQIIKLLYNLMNGVLLDWVSASQSVGWASQVGIQDMTGRGRQRGRHFHGSSFISLQHIYLIFSSRLFYVIHFFVKKLLSSWGAWQKIFFYFL